MQTLYIDVYFLLNFSVDLLSLYFAALLTGLSGVGRRLIFAALIGGGVACASVLLSLSGFFAFLCNLAALTVVCLVAAGKVSGSRKVRFLVAFMMFLLLFGGILTLLWDALDRALPASFFSASTPRRKYLRFAVVILLAVGALKLGKGLLSGVGSVKTANLRFRLFERDFSVTALVDTGNLLKEPTAGTPVVLVKERALRMTFPGGLSDAELAACGRLCVIPMHGASGARILTGFRPQTSEIETKKGFEPIRVVVGIDREEGTFGGYEGLAPSVAVGYVS